MAALLKSVVPGQHQGGRRHSERVSQRQAGPFFTQAKQDQPGQHGPRLGAQQAAFHRPDALPEHGRGLAQPLGQRQQAQHAGRVPPPGVGEVATAAGHHQVGRPDRLDRGAGLARPGPARPARQIRARHFPQLVEDQPGLSRHQPESGKVGKGPADGDGARAIVRETPGRRRDHHNLGRGPLHAQPRHAGLEHGDVADVQEVITGLVNQNAHHSRPHGPGKRSGRSEVRHREVRH